MHTFEYTTTSCLVRGCKRNQSQLLMALFQNHNFERGGWNLRHILTRASSRCFANFFCCCYLHTFRFYKTLVAQPFITVVCFSEKAQPKVKGPLSTNH